MIKQNVENNHVITYSTEGKPILMKDTGFVVHGRATEPVDGLRHEWEEAEDD